MPIAKLNKELIKAMYSLPGSGTRYEDPQGNIRLRNYIARFAYSWNGNLTEDDIVTTANICTTSFLCSSGIQLPSGLLKLLISRHRLICNQEAIANFMENGRYENHLRRLRHELHSNSLHLAQSITYYFPEDTKIITPQGGFMLWVELNKKIDTTELYYKAMQHKISIAPGRMFMLHDQYRNCMRLSFGQQWSPFIEERLQVLGSVIKESF